MARRPSPPTGHDPSRREFFRTFSRQTIQNAGAMAGAAAELRRTSLAAARELLDVNSLSPAESDAASRTNVNPVEPPTLPDSTFRSAYRFTGTSIVVLDQRELPGKVTTFECRAPNEVASAMRTGAITCGPVLGQVAAYAIAMAAASVVDRSEESREQVIRGAAGTIRAGRAEAHAVGWALDRVLARFDSLANAAESGAEICAGLVAEADEIATAAAAAHTEIGRLWAGLISDGSDAAGETPINLLMHGDTGPLACGMVGMGTAGIAALADAGRHVHVWVTDAAPSSEGTRVTALQLTQLDVAHTIVPDTAVGWLFANRRVDAVALRGDTVASNGDIAALLGSRTVAQLASDASIPVHVLAPESAWDRVAKDVSRLKLDLRSAAELGSANAARLNPTLDIVPARFVTAYVSERVVVRPPFKQPRV
jgi:methylthioribose-1-phosphate isomerase